MSEATSAGELERLLRDDDGALYADEAAARAIAIVIKLFEQEHYSWPEWVDRFSAEIKAPGHFRQSQDDASKAEAVLSGDGKSINRNYAELWLAACEELLLEKGLVTRSELDGAFAALRAEERPDEGFAIDDRVVVRDIEPVGHAHLPLFVRGKIGVVERRLGEKSRQAVYSVRFAAQELWGPDASAKDSVSFSIAQPYLAPAGRLD